jgi:hypothetical protein
VTGSRPSLSIGVMIAASASPDRSSPATAPAGRSTDGDPGGQGGLVDAAHAGGDVESVES